MLDADAQFHISYFKLIQSALSFGLLAFVIEKKMCILFEKMCIEKNVYFVEYTLNT